MRKLTHVCVFCGSRPGVRETYADAARTLGKRFAVDGITLVYGASSMGIMGAVADAVLDNDGRAIGVIPSHLTAREVPKNDLTELHVVDSMHERKALMYDRSDAFIALPGGLGTLDELFEILTWSQLGIHRKPCGLLDVDGYFSELVAFLDHQVVEGFVRQEDRELLLVDDDAERLLDALRTADLPATEAWIDESSR